MPKLAFPANVRIRLVNSSIRLLAVDIDGTLLDSKFRIPEANLKSLQRARSQGVQICLVTGRRHTFASPIADLLGFDVCLISSNGAITRTSTGELFHRELLPVATAHNLLRHMSAYKTNAVVTFDKQVKGALVVESKEHLSGTIGRWVENNSPYIEEIIPLEHCLTEDPVQAMFCGSVSCMATAEVLLRDGLLADKVSILKTQYAYRDLCILDVLRNHCSKGTALRRWAEHLNIAREQVMAIGDNYNDVEMLEFAGCPVVMGNASDDMKRRGWQITCDNDCGGVSAAVEQAIGA